MKNIIKRYMKRDVNRSIKKLHSYCASIGGICGHCAIKIECHIFMRASSELSIAFLNAYARELEERKK